MTSKHTRCYVTKAPQRALRVAVLSRGSRHYSPIASGRSPAEASRPHSRSDRTKPAAYNGRSTPMARSGITNGKRLPRLMTLLDSAGSGPVRSTSPYGCAVIRQFRANHRHLLCQRFCRQILSSRDKLPNAHQGSGFEKKSACPTTAFAALAQDTSNLMGLVGPRPLIVGSC